MKIKGFTLIEVLIALICFAGLSFLGILSASFLKGKYEQQIIVDEIKTAVHYAKIQAVVRGSPVYLVPFDQDDNWSKGMKLIQYNSKKDAMDILYQWEWHHSQWNIIWRGVSSFNKIILSNSPGSAISNGKFIVSNPCTKERMVIVLNRLGRIKIKSTN